MELSGPESAPPKMDCEPGMNFRALTLIVLMATWLAPANGSACLRDATGIAAHGHEQGFPSHSHGNDGPSDVQSREIGHQHSGTNDTIHSGAESPVLVRTTQTPTPAADELTRCCEGGRAAPSIDSAAKNAEPRPKNSPSTVLPLVIATVSPDACLTTTAQLRSQQPPPLPYEKNRRPLLI